MPEPSRFRAVCEGCGKTYRVASTERTYTCKVCGETVRPLPENSSPTTPSAPKEPVPPESCPECDAILPKNAKYCEECGVEVADGPASPRSVSKKRDRDSKRRLDARGDLNRAFSRIKLLRIFISINLIAWLLTTVRFALGLASDSPESAAASWVSLVLSSLLAAACFVAAIQIFFQPFLWSVLLASWVTLNSAVACFQELDGEVLPLVWLFRAAWSALFWLALIPTIRASRLMKAHPDLYIARRIQGVRRQRRVRSEDKTEEQAYREASALAAQKAMRTSIVGAAVIVVLSITVGFFAQQGPSDGFSGTRIDAEETPDPPDATPAVTAFAAAWSSDQPANRVAELFKSGATTKRIRSLERMAEKRGWTSGFPALGEAVVVPKGPTGVDVTYSMSGDGPMTVKWDYVEGEWRIRTLKPPQR